MQSGRTDPVCVATGEFKIYFITLNTSLFIALYETQPSNQSQLEQQNSMYIFDCEYQIDLFLIFQKFNLILPNPERSLSNLNHVKNFVQELRRKPRNHHITFDAKTAVNMIIQLFMYNLNY